MVCEELEQLKDGLKPLGLSGKINTAFIERLNPLAPVSRAGVTLRQGVSFLTRRTGALHNIRQS